MNPVKYLISDESEYDIIDDSSFPRSTFSHQKYDNKKNDDSDSFEKFASLKNQRYFKRELQRQSARTIYDLIIDIFVNFQSHTKTNLKRSNERF